MDNVPRAELTKTGRRSGKGRFPSGVRHRWSVTGRGVFALEVHNAVITFRGNKMVEEVETNWCRNFTIWTFQRSPVNIFACADCSHPQQSSSTPHAVDRAANLRNHALATRQKLPAPIVVGKSIASKASIRPGAVAYALANIARQVKHLQ